MPPRIQHHSIPPAELKPSIHELSGEKFSICIIIILEKNLRFIVQYINNSARAESQVPWPRSRHVCGSTCLRMSVYPGPILRPPSTSKAATPGCSSCSCPTPPNTSSQDHSFSPNTVGDASIHDFTSIGFFWEVETRAPCLS